MSMSVNPNALGVGSAICGALAVVAAALRVGGAAGVLFAAAGLLLAFAGALLGRKQGSIPVTVLLGLGLGAVGLVLGVVL